MEENVINAVLEYLKYFCDIIDIYSIWNLCVNIVRLFIEPFNIDSM